MCSQAGSPKLVHLYEIVKAGAVLGAGALELELVTALSNYMTLDRWHSPSVY